MTEKCQCLIVIPKIPPGGSVSADEAQILYCPTHAAAFASNQRIGDCQHFGSQMLHLGRMLGRGEDGHSAVFFGNGHRHLAFEIEMLLTADQKIFAEAVGRRHQRQLHIAAL